jgi:hypothetical protein
MKMGRYVKNTVFMSAAGPVTSAIPTPTRYVVGTAEHIFATKAINTKPAKTFILPKRLVLTDCQYEQYIFFVLLSSKRSCSYHGDEALFKTYRDLIDKTTLMRYGIRGDLFSCKY